MSTGTNVTNPAPRSLRHAQEVIREAQHELNQLLRQRVTIMRRIGTVKQRLICLAVAFGDEVLTAEVLQVLGRGNTRKQPGFTRACRLILMEAGIPLEARQGMRELDRRFPKLVEHLKDPLASVTTVFNRLVASAEVRSFPNGTGRRVWEWIADPGNGAEVSYPRTATDWRQRPPSSRDSSCFGQLETRDVQAPTSTREQVFSRTQDSGLLTTIVVHI